MINTFTINYSQSSYQAHTNLTTKRAFSISSTVYNLILLLDQLSSATAPAAVSFHPSAPATSPASNSHRLSPHTYIRARLNEIPLSAHRGQRRGRSAQGRGRYNGAHLARYRPRRSLPARLINAARAPPCPISAARSAEIPRGASRAALCGAFSEAPPRPIYEFRQPQTGCARGRMPRGGHARTLLAGQRACRSFEAGAFALPRVRSPAPPHCPGRGRALCARECAGLFRRVRGQ